MSQSNIHLVKAAFHAQFKTAMEDRKLDADGYFRKFGLPTVISDPESLLPLKPFFQLINVVAINENMPDFGSFVAQTTPWHRVHSLGPLIEQSKNLESLLRTFCEIASGQSSIVNFNLVEHESHTDFCYVDQPLFPDDIQMEFYRITSMIQLVHLATGPGWVPARVRLNMPETPLAKVCPLIAHSNILFSQADSAFSIPSGLLNLPVRVDAPRVKIQRENIHGASTAEISNAISQIINTYSVATDIHIEQVASLTDMSVRTLQRQLKLRGLKFNDLLNQARFEHAKQMLADAELPVKAVAAALGYSDPAHFTRAFRRWSGVSPTVFRQNR